MMSLGVHGNHLEEREVMVLVWTEARVTRGTDCSALCLSFLCCEHRPVLGFLPLWQESGFPPLAGQGRWQRQRHHLTPPSSHIVLCPSILVSPAELTDQKMWQKLQTSSGHCFTMASVVPPAVQVLGEGADRGSRRWTLWRE